MGNIGLNGLRDAFAWLGCVEEAHVADGAVLFRVDGAEASAVLGGVLADHVRPAHVGSHPAGRPGGMAPRPPRSLASSHPRRDHRAADGARAARGSPGLFDDTDDEPAVVTGYVHREYVPAICETCGDFPEHLGIAYVTHGGRPECETYPDFGLDDVLDALERSR